MNWPDVNTVLFYGLIGWALGVVVNLLADYLPMRRHYEIARTSPFSTVTPIPPHFVPRRVDGRRAPLWAWSGLIAALTRTPISSPPRTTRRVVVELLLIIASPLIVANMPRVDYVWFQLGSAAVLVLISVVDIEHRWIFDEVILFGIALALLRAWMIGLWQDSIDGGVTFGAAFFGLYLLGFVFGLLVQLISNRRIGRTILGFGDVKIAALVGCMVGWKALLPAFFITVFSGAIGAIAFILIRQFGKRGRYRRFSAIPYGPFLALGGAVSLYFPVLAGQIVLRFL